MQVIVSGTGKSGSWLIRGEQLGKAIGAAVIPQAGNCHGFNVAILIKRPPEHTIETARTSGATIVWDVVDAWPQPVGNLWDRFACISWLESSLRRIRPHAVIAATEAMAKDVSEFGLPVLALPHHARPNARKADIRQTIKRVGYEGSLRHLGGLWENRLRSWCSANDAELVFNPDDLCDLDVVVALREHQCYGPSKWKSNVKLANAQAIGLPIVCNRESGYLETSPSGGVAWADSLEEFNAAMASLKPQEARQAASELLMRDTITLEATATKLKAWLETLR
jgi:hypothetical protein